MNMQRCYEGSSTEARFSVLDAPQIKTEFYPLDCSASVSPVSVDASIQTLAPFPSSDFWPPSYGVFLSHDHLHHFLPQNHLRLGYDSFVSDTDLSAGNCFQLESSQSVELSDYSLNTTSFSSGIPFLHPLEQATAAGETMPFLHLPPLSSALKFDGANRQKRLCSGPPLTDPKQSQTLDESFVKTGFLLSSSPTCLSRNTSRIQRQKIGDKTRSMQKLMPWNKKMNTATFLEEAHRYIKFLQTQDETMRWMPIDSAFNHCDGGGEAEVGFLGMLNRQQLLQVVLNSPGVQNLLYSRGLCVFSHEQLVLLKHVTEMTGSISESSGAC